MAAASGSSSGSSSAVVRLIASSPPGQIDKVIEGEFFEAERVVLKRLAVFARSRRAINSCLTSEGVMLQISRARPAGACARATCALAAWPISCPCAQ